MNNINLFPWSSDSKANLVIQMTSDDLVRFSQDLIERTKKEYVTLVKEREEEKYLTREEVKSILNVCDATLWHWARKNYLTPVKLGRKVRYRQSDIDRIMEKGPAE